MPLSKQYSIEGAEEMTAAEVKRNREIDIQIEALALGDIEALAGLYPYISKPVYSYALSILKNRHDAEDILEDTLLNIHKSAASYKPSGRPMSWIMGITSNLCYNKLRREKRLVPGSIEDILPDAVDYTASDPQDSAIIKICMEQLSDIERQIVMLHVLAGLKHRETAQILLLPLSTVLSKYSRALKKLRAALEENHD